MKRLILLLLFAMPALAQCTGYANSKTVDIARLKVPSTQSNFTILISGTWSFLANTGSGGFVANPSGFDICFSDSANFVKYSYDPFETYINTTGQIAVWVGPIATINGNTSASDTQIKLWYGNPGVTTFQGGSAGTAWDSHSKFVQHFPNGTTLTAADTGANGINGTVTGATAAAGIIDGGALIGNGNYIGFGNPGALQLTSGYTLEAWEKMSNLSATGEQVLYANWSQTSNFFGVLLSLGNYTGSNFQVRLVNGIGTSSFVPRFSAATLGDTNWHHIAGTWDGAAQNLFLDGAASGAAIPRPAPSYALANLVRIGDANTGSEISPFNGTIDEVRVSDIARSPDWITAEYNNISSPSTFLSIINNSPGSGPAISNMSCAPNSPSSARCTWTTDVASGSQVRCGTSSGGPFTTYQTTTVYAGSSGVTAHSMVIPGLPNNVSQTAYYCQVLSGNSQGSAVSAAVPTGTFAPVVSTPFTAILSPVTRYNDQYNGVRGLANRGIAANMGAYYPTMWADDGKLYGVGNDTSWLATGHGSYSGFGNGSSLAIFGTNPAGGTASAASASLLTIALVNPLSNFGIAGAGNTCTDGTTSGPGCWVDGATWKTGNGISFNGRLVQHVMRQNGGGGLWGDASLIVSSDHGATWLAPQNYPGGAPKANGDPPPGGTGMWTGYGAGNNCANATIPQHGQDYGFTGSSFFNYGNTDAFVYLMCSRGDLGFAYVARVRVEDFLLLDAAKYQYYTGGDGLLDVNWSSNIASAVATGVQSTGAGNGVCIQGVEFIPDFNRWMFTCGGGPSGTGISATVQIFDAPYPWGPTFTLVAALPRAQAYLNYAPAFTAPLASTYSRISSSPLTSSIVIMTTGQTNGQSAANPAVDEYSPHWFTARLVPQDPSGRGPLRRPVISSSGRNLHLASGLDLFYDFQGLSFAFTVPDRSPRGKYSISLTRATPAILDQFGMINFGFWSGLANNCSPACASPVNYTLPTSYSAGLNDFTVALVFAHYPSSLPAVSGELVLDKTDLQLFRNGTTANSWKVTVGTTTIGPFALTTDVAAGGTTWPALFIRRIGSTVNVYSSAGIGSAPLTVLATGTYAGTLSAANPLNIGATLTGIMSELLIWPRGLSDGLNVVGPCELCLETAVIRSDMAQRGLTIVASAGSGLLFDSQAGLFDSIPGLFDLH